MRPSVGHDRIRLTRDGQVLLELRHRWADGTTLLLFHPVSYWSGLASLTPRPRINLLLYYGVLGARAAWRRGNVQFVLSLSRWPATSRLGASFVSIGYRADFCRTICTVKKLKNMPSLDLFLRRIAIASIAIQTMRAQWHSAPRKRAIRIRGVLLLLSFVIIGGRPTAAGPIVLDQSSFASIDAAGGGAGFFNAQENGNKELAQVFTVANTGILTEIDLVVANQWATLAGKNPIFFFDVRRAVAGVPVEDNSLAIVSREAAIVTNDRNINGDATLVRFTNLGISVTQGDALAIVLRAGFNGAFTWLAGDHIYSGGNSYVREPDNPLNFDYTWYGPYLGVNPGSENAFPFQAFVECADASNCRAFVVPSSPRPPIGVPEPSTLLLLGAAAAVSGAVRFRWR